MNIDVDTQQRCNQPVTINQKLSKSIAIVRHSNDNDLTSQRQELLVKVFSITTAGHGHMVDNSLNYFNTSMVVISCNHMTGQQFLKVVSLDSLGMIHINLGGRARLLEIRFHSTDNHVTLLVGNH